MRAVALPKGQLRFRPRSQGLAMTTNAMNSCVVLMFSHMFFARLYTYVYIYNIHHTYYHTYYVHNNRIYHIYIYIQQSIENPIYFWFFLCVYAFPELVSLNLCNLCLYLMLDSSKGAAATKRAKTLQPSQQRQWQRQQQYHHDDLCKNSTQTSWFKWCNNLTTTQLQSDHSRTTILPQSQREARWSSVKQHEAPPLQQAAFRFSNTLNSAGNSLHVTQESSRYSYPQWELRSRVLDKFHNWSFSLRNIIFCNFPVRKSQKMPKVSCEQYTPLLRQHLYICLSN